ncbi:VOC family protein [Roseibium sp.]|uniref:VOC family protein n=1 Tax=Roseibium sp. TaxID=1936156 RepID=UPI003B5166E0
MTFKPDNFTVWMEIPVSDLDKAIEFYNNVFKTELNLITDMGPNHIAMFPCNCENGIAGHLYPGKPAPKGTGPTIHLACPDTLEETMERFAKAGGEVLSDPIPIPAGRFAYGEDLDGNSIGMFAVNA